jgi:hypothetical protein
VLISHLLKRARGHRIFVLADGKVEAAAHEGFWPGRVSRRLARLQAPATGDGVPPPGTSFLPFKQYNLR